MYESGGVQSHQQHSVDNSFRYKVNQKYATINNEKNQGEQSPFMVSRPLQGQVKSIYSKIAGAQKGRPAIVEVDLRESSGKQVSGIG